ncbi:MAG: NAD(P)H-dependent oxidoreductase [Ignavibacteriales bacterium]|nr:NAD(P)H-dependent oxidoreductase [Ignavibacteriales bacterium]
MKILIVYWHPEPKSFNAALFQKTHETLIAAGHEVKTSNLFEMQFDPVSSRESFTSVKDPEYFKPQLEELHASKENGFSPEIETEIAKIEWCDLMIWQFPLWWFGLPAVLKGWVDRVFAMGRAYGGGKVYGTGVFREKRAMLSLTTGGPEQSYVKGGFNGDMNGILRPIHRGMLQFVGFDVLAPHVVYGPARLSEEERELQLLKYGERLRGIEKEAAIEVGMY